MSEQHGGTEALIAALAADATPGWPLARKLALALCVAVAVAALSFVLAIGPRPDFSAALATVRFDFKFVAAFALTVSAYFLLRQAMRPEMGARPLSAVLLVAPAMVILAVAMEMLAVPGKEWLARWIGHNWLYCMTLIPALSLLPLTILLVVLRQGATTTPRLTGALAGLVAGGIGAMFYAAHCPDDSPFFLATWYPIGIAAIAAIGALAGGRVLRW